MRAGVSREDRQALATWAAECAEHVLPWFEAQHAGDDRPRLAIDACRAWVRTGRFAMADVRRDALAAHAAARDAQPDGAARFAARAAGHAIATAHVPSHAIGAAWYGAKAADAAGASDERDWQYGRLPPRLRRYVLRLCEERPALARVLRYPADPDA